MSQFGSVCLNLDQLGYLCISFAHFGSVSLTLDQFRSIWISFAQFGSVGVTLAPDQIFSEHGVIAMPRYVRMFGNGRKYCG